MDTHNSATEEPTASGGAGELEQRQQLEEDLRRSAAINSAPIRSGIGFKDVIALVRQGIASRKAEEAKRDE